MGENPSKADFATVFDLNINPGNDLRKANPPPAKGLSEYFEINQNPYGGDRDFYKFILDNAIVRLRTIGYKPNKIIR